MLTPIKNIISKELTEYFGMDLSKVAALMEIPSELSHGHLAVPVFQLAKTLRKAPPIIAKEIVEKLLTKDIPEVARIEAVGGYINFHLKDLILFQSLYEQVQKASSQHKLGWSDVGRGKKMVIDYSSPNVAKPMHIGHLRATAIGQAVRNLAQTQGYEVVGLNHLGDWGSQFGKLAYAYEKWSSEYDFKNNAFESLFKLYVRFHEELEKNPELEKVGAETFKKIENGDAQLVKLWKMFIEISMKDFDKQWKRLGVKHDLVRGESFYNDQLKPTEKILEEKGLLIESEGAMVVDLTDEKMPPCLIRKSDGASLYATRDLASAIYRKEVLKSDLSLYVVGAEQTLHFKQVFSVLKRMGFSWWNECHHIGFGLYRFKDMGRMSSRKGQIIRFEDVLNQAVERVAKVITEKNPDLANKSDVAEKVAVGAILFNDLVNDRLRDVDFDWDKAISFEGASGPYIQYVYVRCGGILKKYFSGNAAVDTAIVNSVANAAVVNSVGMTTTSIDFSQLLPPLKDLVGLNSPAERELIKTLMQYEDVLRESFKNFKPSILASYLLDLCSAFNGFYQNHRIVGGEKEFEASRIVLVHITREVIKAGLGVLNIQCPEQM